MKKWTHLYVFVILSGIASLYRLWGAFFTPSFDETQFESLREVLTDVQYNDMINVARATNEFSTNLVNKLLVVVLVLALVGVVVFLVRKQFELASYTYLGYLFGTLIFSTYSYLGSKGIEKLYSDEAMKQGVATASLGFYALGIVLFLIYFGLTVFFHLRKPKEVPSLAQNATDI